MGGVRGGWLSSGGVFREGGGEGGAGGGFFGEFFGGAAAGGEEVGVEEDAGLVFALVVLAGDVGGFVAEGVVAVAGLDFFLEGALGVFDDGGGGGGGEVAEEGEDEAAGGVEAGVEVEGTDQGFESVFEVAGALAALGVVFAGAEAEAGGQAEGEGEGGKGAAVEEGGAAATEGALAVGGEGVKEGVAEEVLEDGVAEEFEALVILWGVGVGGGVGRVGDGGEQKGGVAEAVAEPGLEGSEGRFHGDQDEALE